MAVGDVYEVVVCGDVKGEHVQNVFRLKETVEETDDVPAENLALGIQTAWIPDWKALLSEDFAFNCIYVRRIAPAPGIAFTVLLTDVGEVVSDAIPSTSALLISWYTNLATKRGRGRNYFAGLPENAQEGGLLAATELAAWQALGVLIRGSVPAGGGGSGSWELGVWSEILAAIQDVKTSVVRTNLASMRSRRQRPGTS